METKKENRGGARKNAGGRREGAGRKPVAEYPLTVRTYCRVSEDEYTKIEECAKANGVTVATFIRLAVLEKVKKTK